MTIRGTDSAPSFGSGSVTNKTYVAGSAIDDFTVPAATSGNGTITYAAANLPDGLVFDATGADSPGCPGAEARKICGTPTTAASAATVTITATDADSNTMNTDRGTLTFSVTVEANAVPTFGSGSVSNKTYVAGQAITDFTVPAATGGNGAITYAAANLPDGLVFDATGTDSPGCTGAEAREICGTPTTVGAAQTVTITAQDADANMASSDQGQLTFTIAVDADTAPSFGMGSVTSRTTSPAPPSTSSRCPPPAAATEPSSTRPPACRRASSSTPPARTRTAAREPRRGRSAAPRRSSAAQRR